MLENDNLKNKFNTKELISSQQVSLSSHKKREHENRHASCLLGSGRQNMQILLAGHHLDLFVSLVKKGWRSLHHFAWNGERLSRSSIFVSSMDVDGSASREEAMATMTME